jgi:hypothetical protein
MPLSNPRPSETLRSVRGVPANNPLLAILIIAWDI